MTTRTFDSFDFPKIGVSTFFTIGAPGRVIGNMHTLTMTEIPGELSNFWLMCCRFSQNENPDFQALPGVPGPSNGYGWLRLAFLYRIHSSRGLGDLPKVIS